eukprot:TRINITY_DN10981_c0_g1_i1.p1 TRINITY_DN10981_c0_g1~~TRINITY_DN10981_c0_g1_i1.p1  ORF type:complete len:291 (+),score=73.90 TRINITY_DN10981_c0_g1_i1:138-1010(+)
MDNTSFDTGHTEMIHDAQMDYYGKRLATCSSDGTIKIFDDQQNEVALLTGHEGPVWQVAWADPKFGSILASCSYDRKVMIWRETDTNNWQNIYQLSDNSLSVNSISWAPKEFGLMLASGSSDGTITILSSNGNSFNTVTFPAHLRGVNSVSWGPALNSRPVLVSGGSDNLVKIWAQTENQEFEQIEQALKGHNDWVRDVAWAPLLLSGSSSDITYSPIASCGQDGEVFIWTKSTGEWRKQELGKFDGPVWRVSWSITGNILAVSAGENQVTLWKESLDNVWQKISDLSEN